MIPDWLTGFPYSVMHSLNLDWLLKKVASLDTGGFVRSINNDFTPDPATGNLTLSALNVGALPLSGTAVDSNKLGGKSPEYYASPINLLDNSNFANPVNQRGFVSGTTGGANYCIDRWILQHATGLSLENGFVRVTGLYDFWQKVSHTLKAGVTYTIAARMKAADGARTLWLYAEDSTGNRYGGDEKFNIGEWATLTASFTLTSDINDISVHITNSGDGSVATDVAWVALYEGAYTNDTLPPYVPRAYVVELAECQRYYQKYSNLGFTARNSGIVGYPLQTKMRTIPNVSFGSRYLAGDSNEDMSETYTKTPEANETEIYFTNDFYDGFVTCSVYNVELTADL